MFHAFPAGQRHFGRPSGQDQTAASKIQRGAVQLVVWFHLALLPAQLIAANLTTIAGTGDARNNGARDPTGTNMGNPFGVEIGPDEALYICEVTNHRIWRLDLMAKSLTVVAGTGRRGYSGDSGPALEAELNEPYEVRFAPSGDMYFVEMQNHTVRKVDAKTRRITTVAGTGQPGYGGDGGAATSARLNQPHSIVIDSHSLYIADIGNHRIRRVDLSTGTIESIAGTGDRSMPLDGGSAAGQPVLGPRALALQQQELWVALREGHSVWRLDLRTRDWHHVAGTGKAGYSGDGGPARQAELHGPKGIALSRDGSAFVVDTENQVIRRIDGRTGIITTIAGKGPAHRGFNGDGYAAAHSALNRPHGICVSARGDVFIGDSENHRVRVVRP
jgi:sugar lactone lactonase YvrE